MKPKPPAAKASGGTEGIYYLVRLPSGWRVQAVRAEEFPVEDFGHADYWEQTLASLLAREWQPAVAGEFRTVAACCEELLPLVYAFPRGRVVRQGSKFAVYHGNNLESFMQCDRKAIEACFGIQGRAKWVLDEHEQCVAHDRDRMREVLGLKETWPAASVNWD